MAEGTIQVTEKMGRFVEWANEKGQDEIMRMVSERLAKLKEFDKECPHMTDPDGFKWDDAMEPNDGKEQWKHGGDCNKCRRLEYCKTQCRANKLLKKITTPFLYDCYLKEHPEEAAKEAAKNLSPEDLAKLVNANAVQ